MKIISFVLIIVLSCVKILAQSTFVNLEKIAVTGYIFNEHFEPSFFKIRNITGRFTPVVLDLEKAEQLIAKFDLKRRKYNKKQRRQYIGYKRGDVKYLLVNITCYESEKQFIKDFPDWSTEIEVFLVEGSREKNFLYLINLNENTIGYHRDDF